VKCLVLAAGAGFRLAARSGLKPLAVVAGLSLVERAIATAQAAGADQFYVVCGHSSSQLVAHLDEVARRRAVVIHPVFNPQHTEGNGLSVLAAREHLEREERFALLMADHVFEVGLLASLFGRAPAAGEVVVAVDRDRSNPAVDSGEATRVVVEGGRVRAIAKRLEPFNGFDTGAFICTPAIFDAIEQSVAAGDAALSGATRLLAAAGRLAAHEVTGLGWIDVDTPRDRRLAATRLYQSLRKPSDGFVARWLNRPLSLRVLTPALLRVWPSVTPNRVSLLAFGAGAAAGLLFAIGQPVAGALAVHLSSLLDGSDGEVARLKALASRFGTYLDAVLDRLADGLMLLGVLVYLLDSAALGALIGNQQPTVVVASVGAALVGTLMVSYTSTKAEMELGHRYSGALVGAGRGRDLRLLILAVGGLLAAIHPVTLLGAVTGIATLTLGVVAGRVIWSARAVRVRRPVDVGAARAVVFDFDGTLADSMGALSEAAVGLLREAYGMSTEVAYDAYRNTTGMDFATQLEEIAPGNPRNPELARRFEAVKADLLRSSGPFADALAVLADLNRLGIGVSVCSSTRQELVTRFCARTGISDLAEGVHGLTDDRTKRDQLEQIMRATGLPPRQLLFVGDSLYDARIARRLGIGFIGVARLFTPDEFASVGVPSVVQLSELSPLFGAAYARLRMLPQPEPSSMERKPPAPVPMPAIDRTTDGHVGAEPGDE
jgi:1L-myo-inositol 1-phosphate cytidylyltransferase / CDP-L-myo-inositol myo-inositolphosphotransferase